MNNNLESIPVRDEQLPGVWRIELSSPEYGVDYFDYDSRDEALEALSRLADKIEEHTEEDGIRRELIWKGFISEDELAGEEW